jgi:two-component system, OmpR family, sensor kinase
VNLHRRLIVTMAVLLVVGLAIADIVTYTELRSFLYGRVDAQLDSSERVAYNYLVYAASRGHRPTVDGFADRVSPDTYVMVLDNGRVIVNDPSGLPEHHDPQPVLPAALKVQLAPPNRTFGRHHGVFRPEGDAVDVGAGAQSTAEYRVQALAAPQGTLVTAVSLNPTNDTLNSLVRVELLASLAVLGVLLILAVLTVRRGLRPLEDMTETAGAIASGDLTRRVPAADEETEVGRLGTALNAMLAQIETAFGEKSASEARLRQFVADASHELRTPLTSIRGYSELLRKGGFPDEEGRRRALARVEDEAARMGGLVDDLLLLARLDQGRPLERTPVDLVAVAADAVDDARAVDPGRPITLLASQEVQVAGDRDRLGQVAHNLVRNALTHTPAGTEVVVMVRRDTERATISVADRGPGLDDHQAARVFDRFYRATSARPRSGTGLGLAIVQAISQALGGEATVASNPGRGAVFTVSLPLAEAALDAGPDPHVPGESAASDRKPITRASPTSRATTPRGPGST